VTHALGHARTLTYELDANGNRATATDQLGRTTHFAYDVMGELSGVTNPLTHSWAYTYDPNYNLESVTNPRGATTSYTYSAADRLEATTDALGHEWTFTHDAAGNTLTSQYPTGESVSRTYTTDDLLASSAYSTGESYAVWDGDEIPAEARAEGAERPTVQSRPSSLPAGPPFLQLAAPRSPLRPRAVLSRVSFVVLPVVPQSG